MNRDDIIRMADEANYLNLPITDRNLELQELIKFARLVAAAEREKCAKLCLETEPFYGVMFANAIRARGQE